MGVSATDLEQEQETAGPAGVIVDSRSPSPGKPSRCFALSASRIATSSAALGALLATLLLLVLLCPRGFHSSTGHHHRGSDSAAPRAIAEEQPPTQSGWLLFEASPRVGVASQNASGWTTSGVQWRDKRRSPSGSKWAAASILDDFGLGIEPANENDDEEVEEEEERKESQKPVEHPRHYSKTRKDLREMRAKLEAGRAKPLDEGHKSQGASDTPTSGDVPARATSSRGVEIVNAKPIEKTNEQESFKGAPRSQSEDLNANGRARNQTRDEPARVRRRRRAGPMPPDERGRPILNEFSFPANLVQGMRFVLMCQVLDGEPPIQIKWFKDNADLAAALLANQDNRPHASAEHPKGNSLQTPEGQLAQAMDQVEMISNDELGSSLLFRRVKQQHSGNYTCLASNHFGSSSYSSLMTVKVPPSWRIEPQDHESIMGEQITIDCQAVGNPNPFIRWRFASGIPFDKMISLGSSSSSSSSADLSSQGSDQTQNSVDGTRQQQHLSQFKLINSNHHVQTLENGSLIIRQAGKEHEGLYLCEADSGVEPSLVKQIKLIVHKQAHFIDDIQVTLQPQQQHQDATTNPKGSIIGAKDASSAMQQQQLNQLAMPVKTVRLPQNSSLVRLVCSPFGDPPIQLEWLKDGRLIHTHSSSPGPNGNNNNNEIAFPPDSGESMLQSGTAGEHSSTMGRYHVSTRWNSRPTSLSTFNGAASSSSAPSGLESELLLTNLNRQDAGMYTCTARNAFGQAERKLRLIVQEQPEPPTMVDVAHISSRSIALRWTAPFDGNSPILKYLIEYRRQASSPALESNMGVQQSTSSMLGADRGPIGRSEKLMPVAMRSQTVGGVDASSPFADSRQQAAAMVVGQLLAASSGSGAQIQHTVHDLEPLTRYSMQVIAVNALGQSRPSVALSLRTEEEVPATVPNLVEAVVLSSRSIKLRWTISYSLEHELIDGFFIGYRSFDAASSLLSPLDLSVSPSVELASGATDPSQGNQQGPKQALERPTFTYKTIRLRNQQLNPGELDHSAASHQSSATPVLAPISSVTKSVPASSMMASSPGKSALGQGLPKSAAMDAAAAATEMSSFVMSNFEYVIGGLERNTEYTILIQCFNKKGAGPASDPVMAKTLMSDPPEKLLLAAEELSETSLRVNWRFPGEPSANSGVPHLSVLDPMGGSSSGGARGPIDPVDGFVLTFAKVAPRYLAPKSSGTRALSAKQSSGQQPDSPAARISTQPAPQQSANTNNQHYNPPIQPSQLLDNQWQAIQLAPQQRSHVLKQLECGSWYAMKIWAFNKVGKGEPSELVTVSTRGKAPMAPMGRSFLSINSTQVRLHLGAWHDGGCAIEKFTVQYRVRGQQEWVLVSSNILREQNSVLIRDLAPATTYELLVGGANHVGLTETKYRFTTLDSEGKQVTASHSSFLGGSSSDDDEGALVDYSDDLSIRRDPYDPDGGGAGSSQMYLQPGAGGASGRWLVVARQVLSSPLPFLLFTVCVFLLLLGLMLFHRINNNNNASRGGYHGANSSSGTLTSMNGNGKPNGAGGGGNMSSARSHLGRCSIDGLATIIDGEPPMSSSSATDSPARVNMAGEPRHHMGAGFAPPECTYGGATAAQGTYCSGGPQSASQYQGGPPVEQQHLPSGDCFSAENYAAMGQQGQFYSPHAGQNSIYAGPPSQEQADNRQQYLMQMLLMSPNQNQPQHPVDYGPAEQQQHTSMTASALATMARQKAASGILKPINGSFTGHHHHHQGANFTLGRQLMDMQRVAGQHQETLHQPAASDSYQMSTFKQQNQQDLVSIYQEGGTTNASLTSTSGCGTSTQSQSGGPSESMQHEQQSNCDRGLGVKSQSFCDNTNSNENPQISTTTFPAGSTNENKCDRSSQYDVPFRYLKANSNKASKSANVVGSQC